MDEMKTPLFTEETANDRSSLVIPVSALGECPEQKVEQAFDDLMALEEQTSTTIKHRSIASIIISLVPAGLFTMDVASCTDEISPMVITIEACAAMVVIVGLYRLLLAQPMTKKFTEKRDEILNPDQRNSIVSIQGQLKELIKKTDEQRKKNLNKFFAGDLGVALLALTILMIHSKWTHHCSKHKVTLFIELDEVLMTAVLSTLLMMYLCLRHTMNNLKTKKAEQQNEIIESLSSTYFNT